MVGLPRRQLLRMRAAGREVLRCYAALADGQSNLVLDFLRGQGPFETLRPYPLDGVHDLAHRSSFYYHAHREGEHGHFHTFAHVAGEARPYAHLVAIRVDDHGIARGLFTVNPVVTGERFHPAGDLIAWLDRFVIDDPGPSLLVNRWITAMLRLFRPQIERLLVDRDLAQAEVLSEIDVSIDRQIAAIDRALTRAEGRDGRPPRRAPRRQSRAAPPAPARA